MAWGGSIHYRHSTATAHAIRVDLPSGATYRTRYDRNRGRARARRPPRDATSSSPGAERERERERESESEREREKERVHEVPVAPSVPSPDRTVFRMNPAPGAIRRQRTVLQHLLASPPAVVQSPPPTPCPASDYTAHYGPNKFKQAIRERKKQIGMWSGLGSSLAADVLADCGFDVRTALHARCCHTHSLTHAHSPC